MDLSDFVEMVLVLEVVDSVVLLHGYLSFVYKDVIYASPVGVMCSELGLGIIRLVCSVVSLKPIGWSRPHCSAVCYSLRASGLRQIGSLWQLCGFHLLSFCFWVYHPSHPQYIYAHRFNKC